MNDNYYSLVKGSVEEPKLKTFEAVSTDTYGEFKHEFDDYANHRLVRGNRATRWASYTSVVMLDGMCAHTAYYGEKEGFGTARDIMELVAITDVVEV